MRIGTLILLALLITSVSFAEDRLDKIPSMSGQIEIMDQLGLVEDKLPAEQVRIPTAAKSKKAAPEKIKIHHLADIMTMGD
ncbi:hypothetical protein [Bdellovibrio sp. HCB337]|uniref:hypothetical protein n=1 Tax=Bdellovibrio sp. HCB337 TaxID=3394358 RepID=UPI0039A68603